MESNVNNEVFNTNFDWFLQSLGCSTLEGYLFLRSMRHLNLIKYYVNFVDNFKIV